jgi:prolyl-tRNA synthetase
VTPFDVIILTLDPPSSEAFALSQSLYDLLRQQGFSVIWDERDVRPGVKFNDADLIGIPVQVLVGGRSFKGGSVEVKVRSSGQRQLLAVVEVEDKIADVIRSNLV